MQSCMQDDYKLVVPKIIDRAARYSGNVEIVTRDTDDPTLLHTSTYRDVHRRSQLFCLALRRLNIKAGDRLATLAWNTTRHVESWYGIIGNGAIVHTLNPRLFEKDLTYIINHAEDTTLITDPCFLPLAIKLTAECPCIKNVILLCDKSRMPPTPPELHCQLHCYEELLKECEGDLDGFQWAEVEENQACGLCYTSGTTGKPKGVMYSHRSNYLHSLVACMPDALNFGSNSVILMVVPMFHANSWGLAFAAPLIGAKIVLPAQYLSGESVYTMLQEHKVTLSAAVPTVWQLLHSYLTETKAAKLTHLQEVVIGGSACPRHLIEYFKREHDVSVRHLWGMTETSPLGTACSIPSALAETLDEEGTIKLQLKQGRAAPLIDLRIMNESGDKELPWDGETSGDLQVRGPFVIREYFKSDAKAAAPDGWFSTGDVATIDKNGFMEIVDRTKDVIKSGGEWISSIEIENKVMGHPGVAEAAVIARADEKWGERPFLCVVKNKNGQDLTKEDVLGYLQGKVVKWQIPDDVAFIDEIPHTATGKISKLTLRNMYNKPPDAAFHPE